MRHKVAQNTHADIYRRRTIRKMSVCVDFITESFISAPHLFISRSTPSYEHHVEAREAHDRDEEQPRYAHHHHAGSHKSRRNVEILPSSIIDLYSRGFFKLYILQFSTAAVKGYVTVV